MWRSWGRAEVRRVQWGRALTLKRPRLTPGWGWKPSWGGVGAMRRPASPTSGDHGSLSMGRRCRSEQLSLTMSSWLECSNDQNNHLQLQQSLQHLSSHSGTWSHYNVSPSFKSQSTTNLKSICYVKSLFKIWTIMNCLIAGKLTFMTNSSGHPGV